MSDDDDFLLSDPVELPKFTEEMLSQASARQFDEDEVEIEQKTPKPYLKSVLLFPCYLETVGPLLGMSFWWLVALGLGGMLMTYGLATGSMALRALLPAAAMALLLAASYSFACFLAVVEETGNGEDVVQEWPAFDWKRWVAAILFGGFLFLQASVPGGVAGWLIFGHAWGVAACGAFTAFAFFPFVLLSALEAGAWFPISTELPRTLKTRREPWVFYYCLSFGVTVAYLAVCLPLLIFAPVAGTVVAAPYTAAFWLIQARALGRLAAEISTPEP